MRTSIYSKKDESVGGYRIAGAFGGGGIWGFSHLGVFDEAEKEGLPFDEVGGVSFGALVATIASAYLDKRHRLTREGIDYMLAVASDVQHFDQFRKRNGDRTELALERILSRDGADRQMYADLLRRTPAIPVWVQVRDVRKKANEILLRSGPGTPMADALRRAQASAALRFRPFGFDPVEVDGGLYADDPTVAYKSIYRIVRELRRQGVSTVVGVPISFFDTSGPGEVAQRILDYLVPHLADRGDIEIRPKEGRGPFNGSRNLTNFGKGNMLHMHKYAEHSADLVAGRIAIPVGEMIDAGQLAFRANIRSIRALLDSRRAAGRE